MTTWNVATELLSLDWFDKYSSCCNIFTSDRVLVSETWTSPDPHQAVTMMSLCPLPGVIANINMFSRHHRGPIARVVLGLKAIALGLLAQLLMFGLEMAIELSSFPFPSSILAMFVLFVFLLALGCCWRGFEGFYTNHLRQPVSSTRTRPWINTFYCLGPLLTQGIQANLGNRHMSIGFSVPIVMLARGPVASGDTIARIIACFSM